MEAILHHQNNVFKMTDHAVEQIKKHVEITVSKANQLLLVISTPKAKI
jgi:hypothetical protein